MTGSLRFEMPSDAADQWAIAERAGQEKLIELETMMRCALAPTDCSTPLSVSGLENVKMFFLCILFYVAICV